LGERNEDFFRELYNATCDRLHAYVARRIGHDQIDDVVADTYLAVWRRLADVPDEPSLAYAWVLGTARKVLANTRRSSTRRLRLVTRLGGVRDAGRDTSIEPEHDNEQLRAALGQLKPAQREILRLAAWEELSAEQIAVVLNVSKNAAAIRLMRARHALRDAYEGGSEAGES
jgi:RNA polymerase sigma-70 factor (ECF subfamily)